MTTLIGALVWSEIIITQYKWLQIKQGRLVSCLKLLLMSVWGATSIRILFLGEFFIPVPREGVSEGGAWRSFIPKTLLC